MVYVIMLIGILLILLLLRTKQFVANIYVNCINYKPSTSTSTRRRRTKRFVLFI